MSEKMRRTLRELSRCTYFPAEGKEKSDDSLKIGALLRIADATELIAKDYDKMRKDRDFFKKRAEVRWEEIQALERKLAAERGVKTRYRNRIAELRAELEELKLEIQNKKVK